MLKKFLPEKLIHKGQVIDRSKILEFPLVGLYFAALWCPPCQEFYPIIENFYKKANEKEKQIEFVLCSLDEDEDDFKEFLKKIPFSAIDYNDPKLEDLISVFQVEGIPLLFVFDKNGRLIEKDGRKVMQGKDKLPSEEQVKKWLEKSKSLGEKK